ncbi:hypothetical protein C6P46_003686 [Rhodotorula mucilaginosa]|jgi:hypothetical protein|uniref:Uncharacterized protein n=1 Tax=Rhodotorula mucilaginosa TaxID=5537 RepID=A0A9P7B639_RHOMI|nr:hypothetical protein C6P46_003686 [Rhodotorula mucilaginosa]
MQSVRAEIEYTIGEIEKEIPHIRQAEPEDPREQARQTPVLTDPGKTIQELLDLVKRKMDQIYEMHRQTLERPDRLGTGLTVELALLDNLITLQNLVSQMRWEVLHLTWERVVSLHRHELPFST